VKHRKNIKGFLLMSHPNIYCLEEKRNIEGHVRKHCRACKTFYQREWRKTEKGQKAQDEYNERIKHSPGYEAKKQVFMALKAGRLKRPDDMNCVDCGARAEVYDHRDYNKPLDVEPVCRSCNTFRGPALNK